MGKWVAGGDDGEYALLILERLDENSRQGGDCTRKFWRGLPIAFFVAPHRGRVTCRQPRGPAVHDKPAKPANRIIIGDPDRNNPADAAQFSRANGQVATGPTMTILSKEGV